MAFAHLGESRRTNGVSPLQVKVRLPDTRDDLCPGVFLLLTLV